MLVLALIWWAWSAFVWAANAHDTGSPTLRVALLLAMVVLIFIAGLAVPEAFGPEATLFAVTYAGVRLPAPRALRGRVAARQRVVRRDRRLRRHGR